MNNPDHLLRPPHHQQETQEQINSWARSLSATQQDTVLCHETNTPLIKFANGIDDKAPLDSLPPPNTPLLMSPIKLLTLSIAVAPIIPFADHTPSPLSAHALLNGWGVIVTCCTRGRTPSHDARRTAPSPLTTHPHHPPLQLCHDADPNWAVAQVAGDVTRPLMNPNLDVGTAGWGG